MYSSSGGSYQSSLSSRDNNTGMFGGMNLNHMQPSPYNAKQKQNQQQSFEGTVGMAQLVPSNIGGGGRGEGG